MESKKASPAKIIKKLLEDNILLLYPLVCVGRHFLYMFGTVECEVQPHKTKTKTGQNQFDFF